MQSPTISYGLMTLDRIDEIKTCLRIVESFVDEVVIVDGGSTDGTVEWLKSLNNSKIKLYEIPWEDNFSKQRNNVFTCCTCDWTLVTDTDEFLSEEAATVLRDLAVQSENGSKYNTVKFKCCSKLLDDDGVVIDIGKQDYYRNLFYLTSMKPLYYGMPHELLVSRDWKTVVTELLYYHVRKRTDLLFRGVRNFFIGGGGLNTRAPIWKVFRRKLQEIGIVTVKQFDDLLKTGNVPDWLVDWMIEYRDCDDSEIRGMYLYYFCYLHPTKNPKFVLKYEHPEIVEMGWKRFNKLQEITDDKR